MSTLYYFCKVYPMRAMANTIDSIRTNFRVFVAIALKYVSGNIHYRSLPMNSPNISLLKFKSRQIYKRNIHYWSDWSEPLR